MNIKHIVIVIFLVVLQLAGLMVGMRYLTSLASRHYSAHNEYIALQQKDQDLRFLQENYFRSKDAIDLVDQSMPAKNQIIPFFGRLEQIAQKNDVELAISMKGGPLEDTAQNLVTLLLNLSVKGSYYQLSGFVRDLEQLDQLVIVRQINIKAGAGLSENVSSLVAIKTFFTL